MNNEIWNAIHDYEQQYIRMVERIRSELYAKLRLDKKPREKIYLCRDNGRIYLNTPRKCQNYSEEQVSDFVRKAIDSKTQHMKVRLLALKKIASQMPEHIDHIVGTTIFLKPRGYINVFGIKHPIIVYVSKNHDKTITRKLYKLFPKEQVELLS